MSDTFISLKPKRDVALFDLDGTVLDTYAPILESMRYATKMVFGEALPDSKLVSMVWAASGNSDASVCRRTGLRL